MADTKRFRSAFHGFNREDVVRYIEFLNNQHTAQVAQLNSQLQAAQSASPAEIAALQAQLDAAQQRCAQLEQKLSDAGIYTTDNELETYRRAERAERLARDRAAQIYAQANAALADATVKVESISDSMNTLTQQFQEQMQQGKNQLQEAVASLYAIRPEEE